MAKAIDMADEALLPVRLRDYFAAAALQGIVAHPGMEPDDADPAGCAALAYRFADAMLAARGAQ